MAGSVLKKIGQVIKKLKPKPKVTGPAKFTMDWFDQLDELYEI